MVKVLGITLAVLAGLVTAAAYLIDEPLRQKMEQNLNAVLKGYTVKIEKLDFHPLGLSLDLKNAIIRQKAHPSPPVADIPRLTASVNWQALLYGRLVADFAMDSPKFIVNLTQLREERRDKVPLDKRGWQQALQEIYPLKINEFVVSGGEIVYVDQGEYRPLRIHKIDFEAYNIRNVRSDEGEYPSPFTVAARVFDEGKLKLTGHADFLAEPRPSFRADLECEQLDLSYFQPIFQQYQFSVKEGVLSTVGRVEYAQKRRLIEVPTLIIHRFRGDYIHIKENPPTTEVAKKTDRIIRKQSNDPTLRFIFNEVKVNDGELGMINKSSKPEYRVFISDAVMAIKNLGNHAEGGTATGFLKGKFMGSGSTRISADFTPRAKSADFDLHLSIEQTDLRRMNDLLAAYGNVDVSDGVFSFYSELAVRRGMIDGYVKPLFKNVDVYDRRQDKKKNIVQQMYEGIIDGLSWVLENSRRDEVATTTRVTGDLSNPETSTLQVIVGLVQNAFFKSILPGFEAARRKARNSP